MLCVVQYSTPHTTMLTTIFALVLVVLCTGAPAPAPAPLAHIDHPSPTTRTRRHNIERERMNTVASHTVEGIDGHWDAHGAFESISDLLAKQKDEQAQAQAEAQTGTTFFSPTTMTKVDGEDKGYERQVWKGARKE